MNTGQFNTDSVPWNKGMAGFVHKGSFQKNHAQSNTGRTHFKKGHSPWTKSQPGIHLSPATEFKKGRVSLRKSPIGATVIRKCSGDDLRRYIKVGEPSQWIPYALFVCIQAYGEIPAGQFPHHIDEDPLNDSIDNLQLVTRSEHCRIHAEARRARVN